MPQTPREIVTRCLTFDRPERIPRDLWTLPWAQSRFPERIAEIRRRFPGDLDHPPGVYRPSRRVRGDRHGLGEFVDDWGCRFVNIQAGVIGEVKDPIIPDPADLADLRPPYETLPEDRDAARDTVNRYCAESERFVIAGCCPRPWERMQFLRGTVGAMMDVMDPDAGGRKLLEEIHKFYLAEMAFWATTDVDGFSFMDDWGSQRQLLIPPPVWRELFRPLYRDYADIARQSGKFLFMHSDGHIAQIYDDLVEIGIAAVNSQLAIMDLADLARRVKGRITFWGEIDRQHVMPASDPQVARDAVRRIAAHLHDPRGGIIAQFELGPAGNPENAFAIYEEWEKVHEEARATA